MNDYWRGANGFLGTRSCNPGGSRQAGDHVRSFLNFLIASESSTWFAKLIVVGEMLIGIGLVLGFFTGIAAFFGPS